MIAAGAGAGLAAAFNAPLAGLIFVLEEVQRDFRPVVFGAAFVAAALSNIVARVLLGQTPVFDVPSFPVLPLTTLPLFVVLGLAANIALDVQLRRPDIRQTTGLVMFVLLLWGATSITHTAFTDLLLPLVWAGTGLLAGLGSREMQTVH